MAKTLEFYVSVTTETAAASVDELELRAIEPIVEAAYGATYEHDLGFDIRSELVDQTEIPYGLTECTFLVCVDVDTPAEE